MDFKSVLWILLLIWIVGYMNLYFKEANHLSNLESFDNNLEDDDGDIEGFSNNNQTCRDNGYTKEFCSNSSNPGECVTPSGLPGHLSKRFKENGVPLCVVGEKIEDTLIGMGMGISLDPSMVTNAESSTINHHRLKQEDITTAIDIETGPRYGHTIYKDGIDSENKDENGVQPFNLFINIWGK